jgi:two-component system, OmpR family, sensor histidine kinase VicK
LIATDTYPVLKLIGSLTSDGLFVYNLQDERLEYVNESMIRIFDISHGSFYQQPDFFINHIIPEDVQHLLEEFERLKKESIVENVEFTLKWHDRSVKAIVCNAYAIDGRVFGFLRDITTQRENERYIVNYGAKKDALLDMVSHNLAGPLNLTQNILSSLNKLVADKNNKEIQQHIKLVEDTTNQCIEIVNDFLEEEHLLSEHISVKRTRFDVIEKINNILDKTRPAYPQKQIFLVTEAPVIYANSDEVKFMQIIQNLISNAVKFSKPDGRVEIIAQQMAKSFSVTVRDNGIGIPERLQPALFDKYTPAGRPGLRGERSIGMGLYIVKKLVSILGGRLTFESAEGKGSAFTIQFVSD